MSRRHKVNNATQSSEEGDVFEPLPASRKYFSRQARGKAPRNADPVRVAGPKPSQEHSSGPTSRLDVRPDSAMMGSLAARVESNVTQFSGDDDTVPPLPPRSPLRLTFASGTKTQAGPSNKKREGRLDSVQGGRKLSIVAGSPRPARHASDGSEDVSPTESHESERSNPGQSVLHMIGHLTRRTGNTVKRPSVVSLGPDSPARARDGSRSTTGTDQRNPGAAIHDVLNMYPGNPARRPSRPSVTAIPKVPDDLGVLPETYADDHGCPGPSRSRRKRTHGIEEMEELEEEEEEEEEDGHADDERSPTDTRAPQLPLPETLPSSQPDAFALNAW
ncbi:hypothetical protein Q7P36_002131 [Cladosporium allicinum]